ncbi:ribosome recycling factor [Candidatus Kaiserbacteria bacterium]|nr:ribosome recycling factor [Candidatus Kaiserbacteria bacterium]MCB9811956.1 ribosome recycling factor [Candidatus Nomurabacteria bacterium]
MDETFVKKIQAATDWLRSEYAGIRTGQAAPALLDAIKVESYGTLMPLNQVGSIGIEDARTLRVSPWDAGGIAAIERAIMEADLGVSVATDSAGLRVIFPELTSERREQIKKLAKNKLEDARVRVRAARDDEMKRIDAEEKAGRISEDERFTLKESAQKKVTEANQELDTLYTNKDAEISK